MSITRIVGACAATLVIAACLTPRAVEAQDASVPNSSIRALSVAKVRDIVQIELLGDGAWYSPAQSGSGWYFSDLSLNPSTRLMTAAYFGYDAGGRPAWIVTGGEPYPVLPIIPVQLFNGRPLATWTAPLFEGADGSCPTCTYQRPTVGDSQYRSVTLEIRSPSQMAVRMNGASAATIRAGSVVVGDSLYERLQRRSRGRLVAYGTLPPAYCEFEHRPIENPASGNIWLKESGVPDQSLPHPEARWLAVTQRCSGISYADAASQPFVQGPERIAVPPAGAEWDVAISVRLAPQTFGLPLSPIRNAAAQIEGYQMFRSTITGRWVAAGSNGYAAYYAMNHDTAIVEQVLSAVAVP